jgi:hypothetical protein
MDDEVMTLGEIGRRVIDLERSDQDQDKRLGKMEKGAAAMGVQITNLESSVKTLADNSQKQLTTGYWQLAGLVIVLATLLYQVAMK